MNDIKIWQHTVPSTGRWHTMVSAGWQGIDEQWLGKSPASADTCYMTMDLWKETSRMASPKLEQHQKMSAPVSRWYREHSDIPHFPISAWALSTLRAPTPNNATVPTHQHLDSSSLCYLTTMDEEWTFQPLNNSRGHKEVEFSLRGHIFKNTKNRK